MPAVTNANRPSRMSGRRVSPNCSTLRSTLMSQLDGMRSARHRSKGVAEEQRALGGDQFADRYAVENLPVAVVLGPDLDGPPGELAAIRRHPARHRAIAFAHHAVERNAGRAHRIGDANDEMPEHARAQLVARVADFRAHQNAAGIGIDRGADGGDLAVEHATGKRVEPDLDLLA